MTRPKWIAPIAAVLGIAGALSVLPMVSDHGVANELNSSESPTYTQPKDQFEAALDNMSTSPSYVLITVIDDRAGTTHTGCTLAPFLIGALMIELGKSPQEARALASTEQSHAYHFSNSEALTNLGFGREDDRKSEACAIIRAGEPAFMSDRTGATAAGQP